ncbi:MAG: hypothetical protein K2N60_00840 [Oscillospiraceae bacterium]|nr:hypothetical protein [Oscillospiraceae bacterium]
MNSETDVLEFDFPDYEEPYPPFPDVNIALFDKEDSYSKNRDIADKLYADEKQIAEKKKTARKARRREIKTRGIIAAAAVLILSAVLVTTALDYIKSWEQPETASISEEEKEKLLAWKIDNDPFFEAAKINVLLEKIEKPDRVVGSDHYSVTVNFTVKNTSDEEIGFMPSRFYMKLINGRVVQPHIADSESFSYDGLESPWNGMHIPAGEQVSFSVKYYVYEKSASEIKCFAYNVYDIYTGTNLYTDIADTDGYISRRIEREIARRADKSAVEEAFKPFEEEEGTVVYSTNELSYKIWVSEETSDSLVLNVAIKGLTENDHEIQDESFYISDGTKKIYCQTPVSISRTNGIATVVVQFKKDSGFDCKCFGYNERFNREKDWTVRTDDVEVYIEELL